MSKHPILTAFMAELVTWSILILLMTIWVRPSVLVKEQKYFMPFLRMISVKFKNLKKF